VLEVTGAKRFAEIVVVLVVMMGFILTAVGKSVQLDAANQQIDRLQDRINRCGCKD